MLIPPRCSLVRSRTLVVTATLGLLAGSLTTAAPATAARPGAAVEVSSFEAGRYVVVMKDEPIISYDGGVPGLAATAAAEGEDVEVRSTDARAYRRYLGRRQDAALRRAGNPRAVYRFDTAVSGFAADLSAEQAATLARDPSVLSVAPDELRQPDTSSSPDVLGLSGDSGVWAQLGGPVPQRRGGAGAGVVVGVIDTGITPEHPSFAGAGMRPPRGWRGTCETGEQLVAAACNGKLVGARSFLAGFGADRLAEDDFLSARDVNGHGTHTAATAAGNAGVEAVIGGRSFGTVSGVAPAAHLAAYKVCWEGLGGGGGCATSDSVAAIDQAVADGVDVLNYSISGSTEDYLDPVELAFMYAADAGVFVAASSGNSGPGASTTNHPSPWLTTVAASTHTVRESTLLTGDGERYLGASITEGLPSAPLVLARDVAAADPPAGASAALCQPGTLDPARVTGTIVVCDRGANARVEKSDVVAAAGGLGMVLVNVTESSLDTDLHRIPTVHLPHTERDRLRAYVTGAAEPTGALLAGENAGSTTKVPEVAGFSARGPSLGAEGDILKPDISAPGVGVLAAYSPVPAGRDFDFLSGTSMSSPHIAGLAALIRGANPRWSPMAVKSAMMTTARDHASAASSDVLATGAGFVEPRRFLDPGLVYDSDQDDWWDFLGGQGATYGDGRAVTKTPIDASDLNSPSIAIGALAGKQTVTRTVTKVDDGRSTYRAQVTGMPGVQAVVSPSVLTLRRGQSATFTVTFTRTDAAFGAYSQGHLTWSDASTSVRSPIAVRPVQIATTDEVQLAEGASSFELPVTPGFSGRLTAQVHGMVPAEVTRATAQDTGGARFDTGDARNHRQQLTVPEGATLTRVSLRSANPAGDDLDLFLTDSAGAVVAASASGAADEVVTSASLAPGTYTVHVQAWSVADGGASADFDVRTFVLGTGPAGNLAVAPESTNVTVGRTVNLQGTTSGLEAGTPYLGWVGLGDGGSVIARSLVSVG